MIDDEKKLKLSTSAVFSPPNSTQKNPWVFPTTDLLETDDIDEDKYPDVVDDCRFFYRRDPLASTTLNKMVEIGINDLRFGKNGLSENEFRVFLSIKESLKEFAESMALEFLLSGLVVPEIRYSAVPKNELNRHGIKKYDSLNLPVSMWLRDPKTVHIKSILGDRPSYFAKIPDKFIEFIQNNGKFGDGTKDEALWALLQTSYADMIAEVRSGKTEFLLENPLIIRRKYLSDNPYPIPYLYSALESLKHKRNLRRMDYSIASRVISAIQLFNLGDKDFPIVEEEDGGDPFAFIRNQMYYRFSNSTDIERIFQLFANHTLKISWVFPPTDALLNDAKYQEVNLDIITSLGFPRILITGETERTGTSQPEFAMMSPSRTMEYFRNKILGVLKDIVYEICRLNSFKNEPEIMFEPINLIDYNTFLTSLAGLYSSGNLSRTSYAKALGYTWEDEIDIKVDENAQMKAKGIEDFAPTAHSNAPGIPGDNQNKSEQNNQKTDKNPPKNN